MLTFYQFINEAAPADAAPPDAAGSPQQAPTGPPGGDPMANASDLPPGLSGSLGGGMPPSLGGGGMPPSLDSMGGPMGQMGGNDVQPNSIPIKSLKPMDVWDALEKSIKKSKNKHRHEEEK